jgi:hypothetical protein
MRLVVAFAALVATLPILARANPILPPNLSGAPLSTVESAAPFTFTVTASNPNGVPATLLDLRLRIPAKNSTGGDPTDRVIGGGAGAGGTCTPLPHNLGPKGFPGVPGDSCTGKFSLLTDQDNIPENMDSGTSTVIATGIFADPSSPTGIVSNSVNFTITVKDIPEPASLALLSLAVLGLIGCSRLSRPRIRPPDPEPPLGTLSGGNQQKVALASG